MARRYGWGSFRRLLLVRRANARFVYDGTNLRPSRKLARTVRLPWVLKARRSSAKLAIPTLFCKRLATSTMDQASPVSAGHLFIGHRSIRDSRRYRRRLHKYQRGLQGFIENAGIYTLFRDPNNGGGIHGTLAYDFQGNTIVGGYYDAAGVAHGFIATVPEPSTATLMLIAAGAVAMQPLKRGVRTRR